MKISYNWLKTLINIDLTPQQVDEYLTSSGLEVEGMEIYESIKGGLKGIVIGEVVEKEKHPDADKLSVTKVNIGNPDLLNIPGFLVQKSNIWKLDFDRNKIH